VTDRVKGQSVDEKNAAPWHGNGQFLPDQVGKLRVLVGPGACTIVRLRPLVRKKMRGGHNVRTAVGDVSVLEIDEDIKDRPAPLLDIPMESKRDIAGSVEGYVVVPVKCDLDVRPQNSMKCRKHWARLQGLAENRAPVEQALDPTNLASIVDAVGLGGLREQSVDSLLKPSNYLLGEDFRQAHIPGLHKERSESRTRPLINRGLDHGAPTAPALGL
jgi:hypothetical protein